MAVKHTKVATVADDGTSEVGTSEWNDDHTIDNSTITNDHLAGSIANTKLATDPLARANHTGSQAQSTITNLTTDLSSKAPLNSPTLITPALGTPASGVLTNCTALPAAQLTAGSMQSGMTIPDPTLTFSINAQTGTTYTSVLADAGKIITCSNGSAITFTIPPNSSVAYPIGSSLTVISIGVGLTTFAQGAGVTINSTGAVATAPVLRIAHSSATAIKTATDTWQVVGDIA